jgi:hypothetical protein
MTPYNLTDMYERVGVTFCLRLQGTSSVLKLQEAGSSETLLSM